MKWLSCISAAVCAIGLVTSAQAAIVYGAQSGTGLIVAIDPLTGNVITSFAAPGGLSANNTLVGLTVAQNDTTLLFINSGVAQNAMHRIDIATGTLLNTITVDNWSTNGLSYSEVGGVERVYRAHGTPVGDMHLQAGLGGGESFFFTPGNVAGGVGGDGHGRQFGMYADGLIHEFNQTSGAFIGAGFDNPDDAVGLAYDGFSLFVSTTSGLILTLDADTGAILNRAVVQGGALLEIGATPGALEVPEPASMALAALALGGLAATRRRKAHKDATG